MEDISIKGQDRAANNLSSYVAFTKLDGSLNKIGPTIKLTDRDQLVAYNTGAMKNAIDTISEQRSIVASQMSKNEIQSNILRAER